jgi:2-keto-4-pentenoate hydratase/2-oxohepta-3-ene-1,7-dioic acid hydratase in catechol pathway
LKLATIRHDGTYTAVLIDGDQAKPLNAANGSSRDLLGLVTNGGGADAASFSGDPVASLDTVSFAAPILHPTRNIFCVGKNYSDHAKELASSVFKDTASGPAYPIIFSKVPETVIAHGEPVIFDPAVSSAIDYEGELALIIGKGGRGISKADAISHISGYTILNDITARDIQLQHNQWLLGKSQDGFCPMGPVAVTADEIDLADTGIRTFVNGELRQNANTRDLIFDVPTLIETISAGITLMPGDIIATGTPAGVGMGFDPPRYLKHGDVVRVEIDGIGALENPIVERGR